VKGQTSQYALITDNGMQATG